MDKARVPWGYAVSANGHLVATTGQAQIRHRALLGETAIRVLGALGVRTDQLEQLVDIEEPSELLERLKEGRT